MDIVMEAEVIRLALEVSKRDAEITQLRAELAAERELADRLADTLHKTAHRNDSDAVFYARESALLEWRTRRNK